MRRYALTMAVDPSPNHDVAARLREATEALESVVRDRGLLGALSVDERTRLLSAAGDVYSPDIVGNMELSLEAAR